MFLYKNTVICNCIYRYVNAYNPRYNYLNSAYRLSCFVRSPTSFDALSCVSVQAGFQIFTRTVVENRNKIPIGMSLFRRYPVINTNVHRCNASTLRSCLSLVHIIYFSYQSPITVYNLYLGYLRQICSSINIFLLLIQLWGVWPVDPFSSIIYICMQIIIIIIVILWIIQMISTIIYCKILDLSFVFLYMYIYSHLE